MIAMGEHIIDVMDDGKLIIDSQGFDGNQCEASLGRLLADLKTIGIETATVTETKINRVLATPSHVRVR